MFYSLQGEGRLAGKPSVFIRFSGCPLKCKWCDSKYAWPSRCGDEMSADDIVSKFKSYNCPAVVITGGEPFTNEHFPQLVKSLRSVCKHITVETAGIEYVGGLPIDLVSLSPKLANSTPPELEMALLHEKKRLNKTALTNFMENYNCQMKFVVESGSDIDEIKTILKDCGHRDNAEVMLMPQATEVEDYTIKSRQVADICLNSGYSFSPRLHVLLWGNKRGV